MTSSLLSSIGSEYRRYEALGERAMARLGRDELCSPPPGGGNSVATLVWHLSGNLQSRFTDFLTSDGEKPWRKRDEEFELRDVTREELLEKWREGWACLYRTLEELDDDDLGGMVTIRGVELGVAEALHRSLAHTAYHVGQMVYRAKALKGDAWEYLSIPPGSSEAYDRNPVMEEPNSQNGS